jgi:5'-3' exonuclease
MSNLYDLKNSKDERTGGIFGVLRSVIKEMKLNPGYFPVMCCDSGLSKRRTLIDPKYKNSDKREEQAKLVITGEASYDEYVTEYRKQRNKLIEIFMSVGIPSIKLVGVEGDDIMYILSRITNDSIIITDDKDLLQMLTANCKVRRAIADETWNLDNFLLKNGYSDISDFIMQKAICGDPADNIPTSCKGVSSGTVLSMIKIIKLFYNNHRYDFNKYPRTEGGMKELCKQNDVKYRKSFINFNDGRYLTNLELVDLNKVDFDERIIKSIIETTSNCRQGVNYFNAIRLLSDLEIREVSLDSIMELVNNS